jgi:uncharacterized membrane protein
MVTDQVTRSFGFLKTTAIGGVFFLLPFVVIAFLLGQVAQVAWVVASELGGYLPTQTPLGYASLFVAAVALIVLACFACGIAARRSIASRFTSTIEKYLLMMFPRYAIFKEQLSGNIGGDVFKNRLNPVLLTMQDHRRIAFQVERMADDQVVVYIPGSPDPWSGSVILVPGAKVEPLDVDFGETLGAFEKLGQDTGRLLAIANRAAVTGSSAGDS